MATTSTPDRNRRGPSASVIRNLEPERRSGNIFSRIRASISAAVGIAVAAGGIYYMSHEKPIEETTGKQPVKAASKTPAPAAKSGPSGQPPRPVIETGRGARPPAKKAQKAPESPRIEAGEGASLQVEAGKGASLPPVAEAPQPPLPAPLPPATSVIPQPGIAIVPPAPPPAVAQKAPSPRPEPTIPPARPTPPLPAPPPPPRPPAATPPTPPPAAIAKVIPPPARQPVRPAPAPRPVPASPLTSPRRPERAPAAASRTPTEIVQTVRRTCTVIIKKQSLALDCDPLEGSRSLDVHFTKGHPDSHNRHPVAVTFRRTGQTCRAPTAISPNDNGRELNLSFLCK